MQERGAKTVVIVAPRAFWHLLVQTEVHLNIYLHGSWFPIF